ncbi:MAG: T9SS C-terminal target domain-containing protein [Ignavibacteriae bacterium]|nr:MAG: T9SS C-terminal target domain-containing protein [Ignavibacteriota bacterium]
MQVKTNRILHIIVLIIFLSMKCSTYSQQFWTEVTPLFGAITGFAVNSNNELFAITYWGGVYKSTDKGLSWVQKNQGINDYNLYSILITPSGDMYVGSVNNGVYKSTDNGNQWLLSGLTVNVKIRALIIDANGNIYAGSHGHGIYRSSNQGAAWTNISTPDFVYSMAATSNGYVFAGSGNPEAIWRSTDNGMTFQQVTTGDHNFNTIIAKDDNLYSVTGNLDTDIPFQFNTDNPVSYKFVFSSDQGDNWIIRSTFSNSSHGITLNQNNVLFIGKYINILRSTDGGYNFTQLSSGINQQSGIIISLACDSTGFIYLGETYGKVYRSTETTIGITSHSNTIPRQYKIYQNYPNPFNPATKIKIDVPQEAGNKKLEVRLAVYDILGKEVATLVNEQLSAGSYEVEWNAYQFASGIYFCKLTANDYNETIPMVLIK